MKEQEFRQELTSLLNRYSKESDSNTPDYILAEYLIDCLNHYNSAIIKREHWFGTSNFIDYTKFDKKINIEN